VRGVFIHTVVFGVVNALLVGVWLLTTGSTSTDLNNVLNDPLEAVRHGFWPGIVIAVWAGALVIHTGVWMSSLLPGGRKRRRSRRHDHDRVRPAPPIPVPPAAAAAAATLGDVPHGDIGRQAAQAAIGLVESLANRAGTRPPRPPAAPPSGRQWVAVLFTDLVGSTNLAERLGDATWVQMLGSHRQLVRECVETHRGTEVGTQGDGFLVRFDSPDEAVACAVGLQRKMAAERDGGAFTPEVRIGVHAGEALADDNDLVGRVINLAARVTAAAAPGEILVTEPVADHLSPGIALVDRGLQPLKGIVQPRHLLAVVWRATEDTIVLTDQQADEI
jgi:class 3 adenylate cyclase